MTSKLSIKINRRVVNFQLSILQFSNNFQKLQFSKRSSVASLFENFLPAEALAKAGKIKNSLEIRNLKLKIRGFLENVLSSDIELTSEYSLT